jgi:hypothetical protein
LNPTDTLDEGDDEMKILRDALAITAALTVLPAALAAHEGHAPVLSVSGVLHWLSSPHHLISVVAVVAVAAALVVGAALLRRGGRSGPAAEEG